MTVRAEEAVLKQRGVGCYRNCLTILFFTGLRFGEMAALKWKNVHTDRKTAKICETLLCGEEGRTETKKSKRKPLTTDHVREVIWKPAFEKAGMNTGP